MKKNIVFSLALCALLLPQAIFSSQTWSQWIGQSMQHTYQSFVNYLPDMRNVVALSAVAGLGYSSYKLYQAYAFSQKVEKLKIDLKLTPPDLHILDKNALNFAKIIQKHYVGSPNMPLAAELFKEYGCPVLKQCAWQLETSEQWLGFIRQVNYFSQELGWVTSEVSSLYAIRTLIEKTCNNKELLLSVKAVIEQEENKIMAVAEGFKEPNMTNLFAPANTQNIIKLVNEHIKVYVDKKKEEVVKRWFSRYVCPVLVQHADELEKVENWKRLVEPIFNPSDDPYQRKRKLSSLITLVLACKKPRLSASSKRAFEFYFGS